MDLNLSQEQKLIVGSAERFLGDRYTFESRRRLDAQGDGFASDHWDQFAELGWLMFGLSEDIGGFGRSLVEPVLLMEQFGRVMVMEPYISNILLAARIVDQSNHSEWRQELLPEVISGSMRIALAHSERGISFDSEVVAATATEDANGYILNGSKHIIVGGPSAGKILVTAMLGDEPGYSVFVVDKENSDLKTSTYALLDGTRSMDLTMEDMVVAKSSLLLRAPEAFDILDEAQDCAALASMAQSIGSHRACLDITSEYLKIRSQFGQVIGKFQALQHMMADMFVAYQKSRSALYHALAHIEEEPSERRKAVSIAKIAVGPAGRDSAASGIQLHGGYGFTDEYPIGQHYKYQLVLDSLYGDAEQHARRFANIAY